MTTVQEIYEKGCKELAGVSRCDLVRRTKEYVAQQEGAWSANDVVTLIRGGANGLLLSALLDKAEGETIHIPNNGPITIDDFLSHMSSPKRIECYAPIKGAGVCRYSKNISAVFDDIDGDYALSDCMDCSLSARKIAGEYTIQGNAQCAIDVVAIHANSSILSNAKSRINVGYVSGKSVVRSNRDANIAIGKIITQQGLGRNKWCRIAMNDLEAKEEWFPGPLSENEHTLIYAGRADVSAVMRRNDCSVFMFDEFKNTMPRLMLQNSAGSVFLAYHATLEPKGGFSECENFTARIKRLTVGKKRQAMVNAARRLQAVGVIVESVFDGAEHVLNQNKEGGLIERLRRPEYALLTSYSPDAWFFAQKFKEIVQKVSNVILEPQ